MLNLLAFTLWARKISARRLSDEGPNVVAYLQMSSVESQSTSGMDKICLGNPVSTRGLKVNACLTREEFLTMLSHTCF